MKKKIYIIGKNSNLSKNLVSYLKNTQLVSLENLIELKKKTNLKIKKFI